MNVTVEGIASILKGEYPKILCGPYQMINKRDTAGVKPCDPDHYGKLVTWKAYQEYPTIKIGHIFEAYGYDVKDRIFIVTDIIDVYNTSDRPGITKACLVKELFVLEELWIEINQRQYW